MLILVSGGAASGKSEFAESLVVESPYSNRLYLATMRVWDAEGKRRVERHRRAREGKGFATAECPTNLIQVPVEGGCAVLLEDLSNLLLNELYAGGDAEGRVMEGILSLKETAALTVVVSNDMFADGVDYTGQTAAYAAALAKLNRRIAQAAHKVYEVAAGLPITWKEEGT